LPIKVLIVDDMATYRSIIARSLSLIDNVEVVGKVSNGKKALDFLLQHEVDLVTLDVEMPVMDGLSTLQELRSKRKNVDVVMLSGLSEQAAQLTIKCLELGAVDFVLKPQSASFLENQNQLLEHLKNIIANLSRKLMFKSSARRTLRPKPPPVLPTHPRRTTRLSKPKIVMIGVSTGGPKALGEVFSNFRDPLPFPILIVQHMPPKFTASLAENLNKKGPVHVVEGVDGDVLKNNTAYIAPGGFHMHLFKDDDFGLVLGTSREKPVNSCRPSVDVLFESAVPIFKRGEVLCFIMTGMGKDGADGALALSKAGAYVVSQSEQSCTIYGMPKSVEDMGYQNEVLDLKDIAPFITKSAKIGALSR